MNPFRRDRAAADNSAPAGVQHWMPRYFFNVRGNGFEETDLVGRTCADDVAALAEALGEAGRVLKDLLSQDALSDCGEIEIEDERHRTILTLPLRAAAY